MHSIVVHKSSRNPFVGFCLTTLLLRRLVCRDFSYGDYPPLDVGFLRLRSKNLLSAHR